MKFDYAEARTKYQDFFNKQLKNGSINSHIEERVTIGEEEFLFFIEFLNDANPRMEIRGNDIHLSLHVKGHKAGEAIKGNNIEFIGADSLYCD